MVFTIWEKSLLAILVTGTIAIFARGLLEKVRLIVAGKPDRIRTDRLGERVVRVVKEVLLQSRVIAGRPIVGLMHTAVFFGFILFGIETIDHFLEAFGIPFLEPVLGRGLPVFKNTLAVIAVLVSLAIIGLAFRRFVLVKISPDPKSYSSGLVALFILLLMLTYLNGIQTKPLFEKANWWLHAGIIIAFPPLILRSKHFHILMAPINIFFRTHRLGDYPPLNLDIETLEAAEEVTLGLEKMATVPWKMRMDFLTCVECRRCTDNCPANICGQELDPRGFILAGRKTLARNDVNATVIGNIISETALGQCTSCGACENICPVGIEHLQVLIGAKRAQALAIGTGMVATDFLQTIERYGNPFSAIKEVRAKLLEELQIPLYEKGKSEWLLWLGCVWAYNADARSAVTAMVKVLKNTNVSFGVLEDEACCGHHSRRQGEEMQFQTLARQNLQALSQHGVDKILTPCPHCLHTMRREYPTLDVNFSPQVVHHSEFLTSLIARGALRFNDGQDTAPVLTYHDPCYLGRYENIFEAPREVLKRAGLKIHELPRCREQALCCGGGSAGFVREQKVSRRVDQERKAEIAASGAKVLVTSCPECKMMLSAAVDETKDLAEVIAERMLV
ncbi:MAG: (Fe-S)-binding protein [candidate division KSB1 bacterium]|nr:(Fe-S)-binding protein [candidate division KSB1 bacterium]MDZ7300758.1 (Fe-S)-binding protein [candidate division KSB1 bacterium]MDZ7309972.1 (Fe-S)-binding protein [candidate division KSB1 bacterium]